MRTVSIVRPRLCVGTGAGRRQSFSCTHGSGRDSSLTISVFWDLDNKPPPCVAPYDAAVRLREVALGFGRLIDIVAYANRHAFSFLPSWVRQERQQRKQLDLLEATGLVVANSYVCGYCGRKCTTNLALKKHFKELHERERTKRLRRLESLKGKSKERYKESLTSKELRYWDAASGIITPKVGYGLMGELKRAGFQVHVVSDRPEAADEALKKHIRQSINDGVQCICLVSDDTDFVPVLQLARVRKHHTVVVGDTGALKRYADINFSWTDLASGSAFDRACRMSSLWFPNQAICDSTRETSIGRHILNLDSSDDTDLDAEGIDRDAGKLVDADVVYSDLDADHGGEW